ncbi:YdcF family protein [Hymenobacter nivis]|uniref:YdcF family protein n=1 Tax=Hymenobacter nivis TaxID=1850093 RepID=A0A502GN71_9BACT|nr:YdcF family protein [Hymenobacter nivis]TPG63599.1 YdcF family protein [Hymenobacter nivis]
MFFLLSKILDAALLPTVWLVALLLGALVARQPRRQRQWLRAAAVLALVGTNRALSNEALRAWERPAVPLAALPPRADAAVLLGGITDANRQPADRVYLHAGADRFTNALWLYRAGRVRRIIVSGGSGMVGSQAVSEARQIATLLRLAAVPAADIWLEGRSRNTHENAEFTKQLLARHPGADTLVLVTAAFHMRRAAGCFAQAGVPVLAFPAGFRTIPRSFTPDYWLLPAPAALEQWSLLLHEMAGWAVYKVRGWC